MEPRKGQNAQSHKVDPGYQEKEEPVRPRGGGGKRGGAVATAEKGGSEGAREPTARRKGREEGGRGREREGEGPGRNGTVENQTYC